MELEVISSTEYETRVRPRKRNLDENEAQWYNQEIV